jgi:hypothetical protein
MTNAGKALYYDSLGGVGITFTQIKLGKASWRTHRHMTDLEAR